MSVSNLPLQLNFAQIQADLMMAKRAMEDSAVSGKSLAKYLRGQSGYHLQQAAEKMIKIQIYQSGKPYDNSKIYNHKIHELIGYAQTIPVNLDVPSYVNTHAIMMSGWEAEGRYDVHVVVRSDTLKKCYDELEIWYKRLQSASRKKNTK